MWECLQGAAAQGSEIFVETYDMMYAEIQWRKRIWALLTVQIWQDLGEFLRLG